MKLRAIGYWASVRDMRSGLPDPRDFIDPAWDIEQRFVVADYLRDGRRMSYALGYSPCRLCGCLNGNATFADDSYVWPEGLAHYVEEHAIRLPDEFVAHVHARLDRDDETSVDHQWWQEQRPTGTARQWPRWRVRIGPCEAASAASLARAVSHVAGRSSDALEAELGSGAIIEIALTNPELTASVCDDLQSLRVPFERHEEAMAAPEELLG